MVIVFHKKALEKLIVTNVQKNTLEKLKTRSKVAIDK